MMTARKRILEYIESKGITKYRFYKDIGLSNGYLDKEGSIGSDICEKISYQYKDLSLEWLITGLGSMLKAKETVQEVSIKEKSNIIPIDFAGDVDAVEIPIVDICAAAGHGAINSDHIEQLGVIKLPVNMVKRGTNYCVRIKGSSMAPTIQDSDYVIVRLLEPSEWQDMPDQHVYLVVDREGAAYIKRVKNRLKKGFIVCTSDSIEKSLYPNFNIDADEVFNIFHAEWHFSAKMQNLNETYYSRLKLLEDDMTEIKEYLKRIK
jgi:phage repressor protein C with HTH and peptisase S24 domain